MGKREDELALMARMYEQWEMDAGRMIVSAVATIAYTMGVTSITVDMALITKIAERYDVVCDGDTGVGFNKLIVTLKPKEVTSNNPTKENTDGQA